jgi:hypothetical protein
MGHSNGAAHDPSAPAGHLPGFAREENCNYSAACLVAESRNWVR